MHSIIRKEGRLYCTGCRSFIGSVAEEAEGVLKALRGESITMEEEDWKDPVKVAKFQAQEQEKRNA